MFSNHFLSPFILLAPRTFCVSKLHSVIVHCVKTDFLWVVLSLSSFHRISDWLRSEERSSGPTPRLRQGHLEPVAWEHTQMAFEYFQGPRIHNFPGQPVLGHLQSKRVSWCFSENLLCFSLCTTEKSLIPTSLQPLCRYLWTLIRSLRAFSSPGWWESALSAFPHRRDAPVPSSSLWLWTVQYVHLSCTFKFYAIYNSSTFTVSSFQHLLSSS